MSWFLYPRFLIVLQKIRFVLSTCARRQTSRLSCQRQSEAGERIVWTMFVDVCCDRKCSLLMFIDICLFMHCSLHFITVHYYMIITQFWSPLGPVAVGPRALLRQASHRPRRQQKSWAWREI